MIRAPASLDVSVTTKRSEAASISFQKARLLVAPSEPSPIVYRSDCRDVLSRWHAIGLQDESLRFAVQQPVFDGTGAKQHAHRDGDGAKLVNSQVRDRPRHRRSG